VWALLPAGLDLELPLLVEVDEEEVMEVAPIVNGPEDLSRRGEGA